MMYKLFRLFFRKTFINLNEFTLKVLRYFDNKDNLIANNKWNELFNNKEKIIFDLNENTKLFLYEKSFLSRIIYDKNFEKEEIDYILKTLKPGDTFIDIGANIGLFSLLASRKVGDNGKVICFEPYLETYNKLMENILLNDIKNIDSRNVGLSNKVGKLQFFISDTGFDAWNSFATGYNYRLNNKINLKVSTLDRELEEVDKGLIKIVKIDVEGWEKFVIQGGSEFFKNYSPIVMVEFTEENTFSAGYNVHDIFIELEKFDYIWYRIKNGNLLKEVKQVNYPYINLIAIKKQL